MEGRKKLPPLPRRAPIEYKKRNEAQIERDKERREELIRELTERHGPGGVDDSGTSGPAQLGMPRFFREAISDLEFSISGVKTSTERVISRWTVRGRHTGMLCGVPPTQKDVRIDGISLTLLEDDTPVEEWSYWDLPGLMEQLGARPPASGVNGAAEAPGGSA